MTGDRFAPLKRGEASGLFASGGVCEPKTNPPLSL
jgi:hypothetical protein